VLGHSANSEVGAAKQQSRKERDEEANVFMNTFIRPLKNIPTGSCIETG
jgi:hypothetical protein